MTILTVPALFSAAALIFLLADSFFHMAPDRRKTLIVPGGIQLFAVYTVLVRGKVFPGFFPDEIVTLFIYFFSLYLTFYASTVLFSSQRRILQASLWSLSAIACWILAFFGGKV